MRRGDGGPLGRAIRGSQGTTPQSAIDNWPPPRPPWRFDVPVVPAHVTAIRAGDGSVYVRLADRPDRWSRWRSDGTVDSRAVSTKGIVLLILDLPLVECPDPRAAS